ncbi:MAG: hypothetical protein ACYTEQ_18740 [Planctomycetota bacterium]|jgi:hypothetical protein
MGRPEGGRLKARVKAMKQGLRNETRQPNRLLSRFAMEKKKTVVALCLISVMGLMWVRVLLRQGPDSAEAALLGAKPGLGKAAAPTIQVSFIELPKVEGRNDVLSGDFFDSDDWRNFIGGGKGNVEKVSVISKDGSEEVTRRLANRLRLQAIWLDRNPQAFINDRLLSVGDKINVREGNKTYECEVAGIEENTVLIRCREAEITLKLYR